MTRPPPPAAATCNLFCSRARVAGAGGAGVGRGVGAAAPQVAPAPRGPVGGAEPRAPSVPAACRRPAPSPPLPPALPRPGPRRRSPRCGCSCGGRAPRGGCWAERGERAAPVRGGGAAVQPAAPPCWDRRAGGPGVRAGPGCGLRRGQAWRRRDAAAAITGPGQAPRSAFPPAAAPSGGARSSGRPQPARPPASWRAMAPRLSPSRRAPPPRQLRWPGDGARRAAEASRGTGASSRFPGEGRGGGGASPPGPRPRPRYSRESPSPRAAAGLLGRKTNLRPRPAAPRRPAARSARRRRWGWGRQRPAPPLGRICLPPKARVLALTLPCFGGLSQAPRNISYREPLREGPRRRRLPGPSPASASCRTSGDLCTPLLPNPRARDLFPGRLPLGREGVRSSGRGRTCALL